MMYPVSSEERNESHLRTRFSFFGPKVETIRIDESMFVYIV